MMHRAALLATILVFATAAGYAQRLTPAQQQTISNGAQGREFWIAIPPNEINPFPTSSLEVYIASPYDTDVYVYDAAAGSQRKYRLTANEVRTLSDLRGETSWTWEIREFEKVVRRGIRLTADKPITVSVLNGKPTTSDGYLALPTALWDTSYIVTTYYDFREVKPWGCGFTVIAKEDDTRVRIELRGTGENEATTSGGKRLNSEPFFVLLNEGDIYHVAGDGQTRGVFDLTGTKVTSDKPIGLISSHQRTTMPNLLVNGNGRDHLVEMNAPVSQWDARYVTIELQRKGTNPSARGDVFRVVAAEDDTRWSVTYYDKVTKAQVGQGGGTLQAGQFADLTQSTGPTFLTYGVSVWTADKPIQVVQYSTSANFDGDQLHDPFMINLLPVDRFVNASVFQVPTDTKFTTHKLNLIIEADTADPDYIDNLKSLTIDDVPVWNHPRSVSPTLLFNHIGNNLHWAQIDFGTEAKAHTILSNGEISFGGYIYGFGNVDSYGWPLGPLHPNVVATDTAKPVVDMSPSMDVIADVVVTEKTNIPEQVRPIPEPGDQVDAGIAMVGLSSSDNLTLRVVTAPGERREEATEARYQVVAVDPEMDGSATLYALDYAGNITYEEIEFLAPRFPEIAAPESADLGETGVDTAICSMDQLVIRNTGNDTARITDMQILPEDAGFRIDSDICPLPILIAPGDSTTLTCICFLASASGTYGATLQFTANDQEDPRNILLSARVRETIQVSVQEEPVAANGLSVVSSATGEVMFAGGSWQPSQWALFSLSGEVVMSGTVAPGADVRLFSTQNLSRGLYILRLDGDTQTSSHKLLVD